MIKYISTRGEDNKKYKFSSSLLKGIALDNGLLSPEKIPTVSSTELESLIGKSYQEIALFIFKKFETDFKNEVLEKVVGHAYGKNFDRPEITPVIKLKQNQFLIELWHGPTAAFKDIALQLMPKLFLEALKKTNQKNKYLILAATSGDTGKAALEGYKNLKNLSIIVLYPKNKVSNLQELQMTTQDGDNVKVLAVNGDFDKTQTLVKEIFNDREFNEHLEEQFQTKLTSANSINWGRLIPQIIYYFSGYLHLVQENNLKLGQKINIAVPTGNFGNILGAFIAKQMGLPISKLICATNENNAVSEFLKTGTYDISKKSMKPTLSPAMDILIASNIERLLFFITKDTSKVAEWMSQLKSIGKLTVDHKTLKVLNANFQSYWVSNKHTLKTIADTYKKNDYLCDPHTAVALKAADFFSSNSNEPMLISSTAHWSKFPSAIYQALNLGESDPDEFQLLKKISTLKNVSSPPKGITSLSKNKVRFKKVISYDLNELRGSILTHLSNVKT